MFARAFTFACISRSAACRSGYVTRLARDGGSWLEAKHRPGVDARVVCRAMLARDERPTRKSVKVVQARGSPTARELGARLSAATAATQVKTRLTAKLSAIHVGGQHGGPRWSSDLDVVEIGDADGLAHHDGDCLRGGEA